MSNEPDLKTALRDAARIVALGKLTAFEECCRSIGGMLRAEKFPIADAVDGLLRIALANDLICTHGRPLIEQTISDAFAEESA